MSDLLGFLGIGLLNRGESLSAKILGIWTNGDPRTLVGVVDFSNSTRLAKISTSLEVEPIGVREDMILESQ